MRKSLQVLWVVLVCSLLAGGWILAAESGSEVYRLWVAADEAQRDWLSGAGYDIAGHALSIDRVEVITDAPGRAALLSAGFSFEVLETRAGPRPLTGSQSAPGGDAPLPDTLYHDPAEIELFLQGVAADHPLITRLESIGTSHQGRTIWAMLISDNAATDEDELSVLFNAAHHAREVMTPEVIMDTIDQLTDNYGTDPVLTGYVDSYQIWCVPVVNPDGVARVHEVDDFWRKNVRDNDSNGTINSLDGVDLNRNYEWGWGGQCNGSSSSISSSTYRGPSEASEPEPQALLSLGRRIRPVFDVEYHSYGEDVFYALSCDPSFAPTLSTIPGTNKSISKVIAEAYAASIVQADGGIGFSAAPYGSRVDGTGRDQQYHETGAIAFVTEINSSAQGGFHPDYATWRDPTVEGQRAGWTHLLDRMGGPAVAGHVTDAVSGEPVEAIVALDEMGLPDGKLLTSHPVTGRFHLIVIPGSYTLQVRAEGYQPASVPVVVGTGSFQDVVVPLEPLGAMLVADEDFEDAGTAATWTSGFLGDTATDGQWVWGEPEGTHTGSITSNLTFGNARFDRSAGLGTRAFVTGNQPAATYTSDDVDGGVTTLVSPEFDLSGLYSARVSWQHWFKKETADPFDRLEVEASADGGASWHLLRQIVETSETADASPAWVGDGALVDTVLPVGSSLRLRFRVFDDGADNVVEGAIDEFRIYAHALASDGEISGVRLSDPGNTVLDWDSVPGDGGASYDVVRGDLSNLSGGGGGVNLGALSCIEEDSTDTSTSGHPDAEMPAAGQGHFYLVRFQLGFSLGGWGQGSGGGDRSGTGGCSP